MAENAIDLQLRRRDFLSQVKVLKVDASNPRTLMIRREATQKLRNNWLKDYCWQKYRPQNGTVNSVLECNKNHGETPYKRFRTEEVSMEGNPPPPYGSVYGKTPDSNRKLPKLTDSNRILPKLTLRSVKADHDLEEFAVRALGRNCGSIPHLFEKKQSVPLYSSRENLEQWRAEITKIVPPRIPHAVPVKLKAAKSTLLAEGEYLTNSLPTFHPVRKSTPLHYIVHSEWFSEKSSMKIVKGCMSNRLTFGWT